MRSGTIKSFSRSRRYGFIRSDVDGRDIFVHLSAVREAGLADLRKGRKVNFEICDNRGRAVAKNLRLAEDVRFESERAAVPIRKKILGTWGSEMRFAKVKKTNLKRTPMSRSALEQTLAEMIRASDQRCKGLIEIFVERIVPVSRESANWAVKGVKYGKADREKCSAAIVRCVEKGQLEFEVSD